MYALNNREEHENSLDVVTSMIQVVYALLDPEASLSFAAPYVTMNFEIILDQLSESFSVSTLVGDHSSR